MNEKETKENELKQKYGSKTISELETTARDFLKNHHEQRAQFIEILSYLHLTNRFRENTRYRNSSFNEYIKDKFNMLYTTYTNERFAYLKYPEQTEEYGSGLIIKIRKDCGVDKVDKVIETMKVEEGNKKTPLKREFISKIIKRYSKPPSPAKKKKGEEKAKLHQVDDLVYHQKELVKEGEKKDDRIEKLLASVESWKSRALKAEEQLRIIQSFVNKKMPIEKETVIA